MLVCMGAGALLANGATGPLAALATLVLPPELKSFALSLYEFLVGLMGPAYSVVMGIGLQARSLLLQLFSCLSGEENLTQPTQSSWASACRRVPSCCNSFLASKVRRTSPAYSVVMGIGLQARSLLLQYFSCL
jgi:hypothetical protein